MIVVCCMTATINLPNNTVVFKASNLTYGANIAIISIGKWKKVVSYCKYQNEDRKESHLPHETGSVKISSGEIARNVGKGSGGEWGEMPGTVWNWLKLVETLTISGKPQSRRLWVRRLLRESWAICILATASVFCCREILNALL